MTKPIYICLWFNGNAKEAAEFYCSVFKNSVITASTPMLVTFEINGQKLMCLNGGPDFTFNEAISFVIDCTSQDEIDYYWNILIADGGKESMCGWLKDKYGVSWQVVPGMIEKLMLANEPEKYNAMMQVLLKMKKLDIAELKAAYEAG